MDPAVTVILLIVFAKPLTKALNELWDWVFSSAIDGGIVIMQKIGESLPDSEPIKPEPKYDIEPVKGLFD